MKKDFRRTALNYEDARIRREWYNLTLDFAASCATLTLMTLLCYAIVLYAK